MVPTGHGSACFIIAPSSLSLSACRPDPGLAQELTSRAVSISGARDLLLQPPLAGRAVCRRVEEHVYSSLCFFPDQSSAPHFVRCVFSTLVSSRWVLLILHTNLLTSGGDISRCAGGEVNGMSLKLIVVQALIDKPISRS